MKKHSSNIKKLKVNRNFFILQGIILLLLLILCWGSWGKIILFFISEIAIYFACIYYFLSVKRKKKKQPTYKTRQPAYTENRISSTNKFRNKKSNYNWNLHDKSKETSVKTERTLPKPIATEDTKSMPSKPVKSLRGSPNKFVPYRSPFDPIKPKEDVSQAPETTETIQAEAEKQDTEIVIADQQPVIVDQTIPSVTTECNKPTAKPPLAQNKPVNSYASATLPSVPIHAEKAPQEDNKPSISQIKAPSARTAKYDPPVDLLKKNKVLDYDDETKAYIEYNSHKLIDTLASFGVGAKVLDVSMGPTVTRYEIQPNAGVKVSKIINLADDIALNLAATGVRIEAPIPGKAAIGIEIPNKNNMPVCLRDVVETEIFRNYRSKLAFAVGKDIAGNVVVGDIAKMPHLLIAGATGSGKSVCINTLITSILYKATPEQVRFLMVDPKVVELGIYNGIAHLLIPVVTEPKKAAGALNWAVIEMNNRYKLFAENNVRDLNGYNELIRERGEGEALPQIVIIIDELADLMMVAPSEVEDSICRLAQMARAAGMHLVIATQRPSVNVITGVIKANIPSRISFAVSSQIDSRTILDMAGAEKLLGRGDMLFYPIGQPKPLRVQGSFISDKEVERVVAHIKSLQSAQYDDDIMQKINSQTAAEPTKQNTNSDDDLLPQAIEMVLELGQASASLIQRKFKVGYSRAARILDQMESWGIVGTSDGSKPRQILVTKQEWDELNA